MKKVIIGMIAIAVFVGCKKTDSDEKACWECKLNATTFQFDLNGKYVDYGCNLSTNQMNSQPLTDLNGNIIPGKATDFCRKK